MKKINTIHTIHTKHIGKKIEKEFDIIGDNNRNCGTIKVKINWNNPLKVKNF